MPQCAGMTLRKKQCRRSATFNFPFCDLHHTPEMKAAVRERYFCTREPAAAAAPVDSASGTLVLLGGAPGSGKSTLATALAAASGAPVFSADDHFVGEDGVYRFDRSQLGAAHEGCRAACVRALESRAPLVFVANTFTSEQEWAPYLRMAKRCGYTSQS